MSIFEYFVLLIKFQCRLAPLSIPSLTNYFLLFLVDPAQIEKIGIQPYLNTPLAKEWPTLIGPAWAGAATFNISEVNARYTPIGVEPLIKFTVELDPWDKPFIRLGVCRLFTLMFNGKG